MRPPFQTHTASDFFRADRGNHCKWRPGVLEVPG
jgi:hypothetical protein